MQEPTSRSGLTAWELVIVIAVCILLAWLLIRSEVWRRPESRPRVSPVITNLRSMATAIEAYFVDNAQYPAWGIGNTGPGGTQTYNYGLAGGRSHQGDPTLLPNFMMSGTAPGQRFMTLTTPVAYITSYRPDPFSPAKRATFVYWAIEPGRSNPSSNIVGDETPYGWILISAGPDGDYDIPGNWDVYNPAVSQPSPRLLAGTGKNGSAFTYDPTNGTKSNGDVWRVKQ